MKGIYTQDLNRALEHETQVREALRTALQGATHIDALILLPLIERSGKLERDIAALANAAKDDEEGGLA